MFTLFGALLDAILFTMLALLVGLWPLVLIVVLIWLFKKKK